MAKTKNESAIEELGQILADFFKDNPKKITFWLLTPNFNFGGMTPAKFIELRPQKAIKVIRNMRNEA